MPTTERLIHQMLRLIDDRRFAELDATTAPDITYQRPGHPPRRTLAAVPAFYLHERQVAPGRHAVELVAAAGDWAMAYGGFSGITKAGRAVDTRFSELYRISNELVMFRRRYFFQPINIGFPSNHQRYL